MLISYNIDIGLNIIIITNDYFNRHRYSVTRDAGHGHLILGKLSRIKQKNQMQT